jgi:hypothetical protein
MKSEWMLTDDEIVKLIEQLEEMEPQPSLSRWMAKAQTKKILEYLIEHPEGTFPYTYIKQLNEMLKQLESDKK